MKAEFIPASQLLIALKKGFDPDVCSIIEVNGEPKLCTYLRDITGKGLHEYHVIETGEKIQVEGEPRLCYEAYSQIVLGK
jgi:hypothetical protein